jgi:hypothetical protein
MASGPPATVTALVCRPRRKSAHGSASPLPRKHTEWNAASRRATRRRSARRADPRRELHAVHPSGVLAEHLAGHAIGRRRETLDGFGNRSREMPVQTADSALAPPTSSGASPGWRSAKRRSANPRSATTSSEFGWAQLLRRHKLLSPEGRAQLRRAVPEAVRVCRSPAARGLAGYLGTQSSR